MLRKTPTPRNGRPKDRNICLLLEYDGLPFHGWQVQPQRPTVQATLQEVISRITGERVTVKGSGRTDAGVHALGQVANFFTGSRLKAEEILRAVNSLSPPALSVLAAREVPAEFDAQYSALGKTYRYLLLLRPTRSPLDRDRSWHPPFHINLHRMRKAGRILLGKHDFSAFRSSGCAARDPVRTISRLAVRRQGSRAVIDVAADGFLRHMVRNIVGTLVDIGRGRIAPDSIPAILASADRSLAGAAAPPHGLYLLFVDYPPPFTWTETMSGRPIPGRGKDISPLTSVPEIKRILPVPKGK